MTHGHIPFHVLLVMGMVSALIKHKAHTNGGVVRFKDVLGWWLVMGVGERGEGILVLTWEML